MKKWLIAAGVLLAAFCVLYGMNIIRFNPLLLPEDAVPGVDVSEYQGDIDWPVLKEQGIRFAYIRATEGSGYTDACFAQNWDAVQKTGIRAGAYHFFSFDSPAETQAENFIAAVKPFEGMLPPVIDLELYGKYKRSPQVPSAVLSEVRQLSDLLEAAYGVKPVLYVTWKSHELYIRDCGMENPIWARDVFLPPYWAEDWVIWQHSDKGRLCGYSGREKYIDLDVLSEGGFAALCGENGGY